MNYSKKCPESPCVSLRSRHRWRGVALSRRDAGRSAFAQTPANKGFALFICTANGVVQEWNQEPEKFWPTELGPLTTESMNAFAADRCTGLLADHAERLLIIKGVDYPAGLSGCGHAQGLVQCLTARPSSGGGNGATSTGVSVDTVMSDALNADGVGPLTLYSGVKEGYINEKLSFSAPGQVRAAEGNPYNVYQRIAGLLEETTDQPTGMADQLLARRKSVNDLVREQINDLKAKPQLSVADRDRLDLHFSTIRDIENAMGGLSLSCTDDGIDGAAIEAMNTGQAFRQNGVIEDVAKLHMDLVALTFACNANRVATLQIGDGTDHTRYVIDGETVERFHYISHRVQSDGSSVQRFPKRSSGTPPSIASACRRSSISWIAGPNTTRRTGPYSTMPLPCGPATFPSAHPTASQLADHHRGQSGWVPQARRLHRRRQGHERLADEHPAHVRRRTDGGFRFGRDGPHRRHAGRLTDPFPALAVQTAMASTAPLSPLPRSGQDRPMYEAPSIGRYVVLALAPALVLSLLTGCRTTKASDSDLGSVKVVRVQNPSDDRSGAEHCAAGGSPCRPLAPGQEIPKSGFVRTFAGSGVTLDLGQGRRIELGPAQRNEALRAGGGTDPR